MELLTKLDERNIMRNQPPWEDVLVMKDVRGYTMLTCKEK